MANRKAMLRIMLEKLGMKGFCIEFFQIIKIFNGKKLTL